LTEEKRSADSMLGKGLRLLVALGDHPDGAGVSQLARDVEVPVSTLPAAAFSISAGQIEACRDGSSPR